MSTHIVIPVRDQLHLTQSIVKQLQQQVVSWDCCWIFDNGSSSGTQDYLRRLTTRQKGVGRFIWLESPGEGIYEMWDEGFSLAKQWGADYIAILNNDLELSHNLIQHLADALEECQADISYPDYTGEVVHAPSYRYTQGTYRHGGMSGFCFMLRASVVDWSPLVDPQFRWWGGDDDIAFNIEKRGGQQVRVMGAPVRHLNEGTARFHDLEAQKGADLEAVIRKWGR